jgi:aryl-alcohol dehydrogenase-like predicted oxidoreductase
VVSSKSAHLHNVVDVLHAIARERNKTVPQVALNWVLQRPTVANVVIGARTEAQLLENFGAVGWSLSAAEVTRLDEVSTVKPIYPYWHQRIFPQLGH